MKNPFNRSGSGYPYGSKKRITPEGEPLEGSGLSRSIVRIIIPVIIGIIIISVIAISSVRIVDAGNRGVLVQFGNEDTENCRKRNFCIQRLARCKYSSSFKLSRKS